MSVTEQELKDRLIRLKAFAGETAKADTLINSDNAFSRALTDLNVMSVALALSEMADAAMLPSNVVLHGKEAPLLMGLALDPSILATVMTLTLCSYMLSESDHLLAQV